MKVRMTSSRILRSRPDGSVLCRLGVMALSHVYTTGGRRAATGRTYRGLMPRHQRSYCSAMETELVSLNSLRFSLVGPGNVGSSLAHWLVSIGSRLQRVASTDDRSAATLVEKLGGQSTPLPRLSSNKTDLLILAVSDPALEEVVRVLSLLPQAPVVLHTSGRATAEILAPLRRLGSAVGSLHPLKAFPEPLTDPSEAVATVFGIDGDPKATQLASRLVGTLGGTTIQVPPSVRSQYHLAATTAAGGVLTLLASVVELSEAIGLDRAVIDGFLSLAGGAVRQAAAAESIADAITGPVARGDLEGLLTQIEQVRDLDPELADLLILLAKRTLHHCEQTGERSL